MDRNTATINASVLNYIDAPVVCIIDGRVVEYASGAEALRDRLFRPEPAGPDISSAYIVDSITVSSGKIVINMKKELHARPDMEETWIKDHIKRYGTSPDLFDGA